MGYNNYMGRLVAATLILSLGIILSVIMYIWLAGQDTYLAEFWLILAGITFFLASCLVISGLLFESGFRSKRYQ